MPGPKYRVRKHYEYWHVYRWDKRDACYRGLIDAAFPTVQECWAFIAGKEHKQPKWA